MTFHSISYSVAVYYIFIQKNIMYFPLLWLLIVQVHSMLSCYASVCAEGGARVYSAF